MTYDKQFLYELDQVKNKKIFARITALNFAELPLQTITGRTTQGSINVDGTSAVRRTCSLTLVSDSFDYQDYLWGVNTKFKLEVGVENTINPLYPEIIWFNQGKFLITSLNTARGTNNFTITLQGKDKMSMLNGDIGGSLESSVDFGKIEEEDQYGNWVIRSIPIVDIIRNAVHTYANEPYHNIVINDLDTYGLELLEYRYETPMYLYRALSNTIYKNAMLLSNNDYYKVWKKGEEGDYQEVNLVELSGEYFEPLVESLAQQNDTEFVYLKFSNNDIPEDIVIDPMYEKYLQENENGEIFIPYYFTKIEYGETAGYRMTELTYAGDLIANIGESLTSVLDKIRNMLVEFEYFYDLEGRFVFQKKKSFVSVLWSPNKEKDEYAYVQNLAEYTNNFYSFSNNSLISSFNNNPNLLNLRNDFSIWGNRKTTGGVDVPIHMRYAIDRKPIAYTTIYVEEDNEEVKAYNDKYGTNLKGQTNQITYISSGDYHDTGENEVYCDWREVIYQMALDYYRYNILEDFELRLLAANTLYPTGITGYEQYYIDLQGFWRDLYYPTIENEVIAMGEELSGLTIDKNGKEDKLEKAQDELDIKKAEYDKIVDEIESYTKWLEECGITEPDDKLIGLNASLSEIYNEINELQKDINELVVALDRLIEAIEYKKSKFKSLSEDKEKYYIGENDQHYGWRIDVYQQPASLNFWFDFLESEGELAKYSVYNIGDRPKAINDNNVKAIYFRETPDVIFTEETIGETEQLGAYRYIQIANNENMFTISPQGKSAKDKLDELLNQHSYSIESATINCIPIYYLEPNVRIHIFDKETNIDGEYIVSKFTIPLTHNGTMSITATKVVDTII